MGASSSIPSTWRQPDRACQGGTSPPWRSVPPCRPLDRLDSPREVVGMDDRHTRTQLPRPARPSRRPARPARTSLLGSAAYPNPSAHSPRPTRGGPAARPHAPARAWPGQRAGAERPRRGRLDPVEKVLTKPPPHGQRLNREEPEALRRRWRVAQDRPGIRRHSGAVAGTASPEQGPRRSAAVGACGDAGRCSPASRSSS